MTEQLAPVSEPTWQEQREHRKVFRSRFPDAESVLAGLREVLASSYPSRLVSIERRPNEWRSTFPSEVVTCRFADGHELGVLCKYGLTEYMSGHGHRSGVTHEALVYRRILNPLALRPICYGAYDTAGGDTWLVLEYIEGVPRLELSEPGVPVLSLAAAWSGRFHAMTEGEIASDAASFISTYDAAYYAGWCTRTSAYAGDWHSEFPWLRGLCERFSRVAGDLLRGHEVVVHGEYTPHNVLARGTEMFPVDWESAAVGAGEIDLASLTDMWPEPLVEDAIAEYVRARWGGSAPDPFRERLSAARMYWVLRWLGNRPDLTAREKNRTRFELLLGYGSELGLI